MSSDDLNVLIKYQNLQRIVFCGKQFYDRYIDHPIINKSIYIFNMFDANQSVYNRRKEYSQNVTYTGSLISEKGFHVLAKYWKKVLKAVPDAKLHVIGSGQLYNRESKLGKYGLAEDRYEKKFMKYLTDSNGKIIESVYFHGIMGKEKFSLYNDTAVGVINPTARTETFGMSVLEMNACGVPVVSKADEGLLDTLKNNINGLNYKFEFILPYKIIKLLKEKELNYNLGRQGQEYVNSNFSPELIIEQWIACFNEIINNHSVRYCMPDDFYFSHKKFLRIQIHNMRERWKNIPSLHQLNYRYLIHNIIEKTRRVN